MVFFRLARERTPLLTDWLTVLSIYILYYNIRAAAAASALQLCAFGFACTYGCVSGWLLRGEEARKYGGSGSSGSRRYELYCILVYIHSQRSSSKKKESQFFSPRLRSMQPAIKSIFEISWGLYFGSSWLHACMCRLGIAIEVHTYVLVCETDERTNWRKNRSSHYI